MNLSIKLTYVDIFFFFPNLFIIWNQRICYKSHIKGYFYFFWEICLLSSTFPFLP